METGEERERENEELSFAPLVKSVFNSTDHHFLLHFLPPAEA